MDTVFVGGSVFAPGSSGARRAAVALRGGRIAAVGPDEELLAAAAAGSEIVDATGRMIMPAFVDAHAHPLVAGVEAGQCELSTAGSADETLAIVRRYAQTCTGWIVGGGWSMDHFAGGSPHRDLLDAVVPDRPAALISRDHHTLWANSAAIAAAGVTARTQDPPGGRIEREVGGEPAGVFHERAMELMLAAQPPAPLQHMVTGLLNAERELLDFGVTAWLDARVGVQQGLSDTLEAYELAQAEGMLRGRATAALWWDPERGLEQIEELVAKRERVAALPGERLRADVVKIMVDGVAENHSAAISHPYLDADGVATDSCGQSFIPAAELARVVRGLFDAGFDLHFHSLGDRAVTEVLDAIEAAPRRRRATLAHLQMVQEADVPRFRADIAASPQMLWAQHEPQLTELTFPFIAPQLVERHYPFGELARAGARLAAGSDWPVSTPDPLQAVQIGVLRRDPAHDAPPLGDPGQRLTLAQALTAYTSGAAWSLRRERELGTMRPGSTADLVVLDRDLFAHPPEEIAQARVLSTWIDGRRVPDSAQDPDQDSARAA